MAELNDILLAQWQGLRQLTYDYLAVLEPAHFVLKLPFERSQTLGYQFWCMVGAQESYTKKLQHGSWQGFSSSLGQFREYTSPIVIRQMQMADEALAQMLSTMSIDQCLQNGENAYDVVFRIIKHESHHHGQLINFMFYFRLPIPASWRDEWALSYDD